MLGHLSLLASQIDLSPLPQASNNLIPKILSIVIAVVGALSLLFIVVGGFRYILSQGDPQGVAKAKGTIMYALIGIVVVVLAQAIVVFVIKGVK